MSTVKDKMIEELAIYVATVRDGGDVGLDDEQMAAKAFGILSEAAESNMEGGDFGVLSDLLTMDVEEFIEDTWGAPVPNDNAAALRQAAEILLKVAESL